MSVDLRAELDDFVDGRALVTDQLTGQRGDRDAARYDEEFIALPHADGSTSIAYNPPPGSSARLNQIAAGRFLHAQEWRCLHTAPPGRRTPEYRLSKGVTVSLTYCGSPLTLSRIGSNLRGSL